MKIAIVSDRIYPFFKGGAEKRYWDIARYLAEKGHKVSFYTAQWPGMKKKMNIRGIKIYSVYKVKNFYVNGRKSIKESLIFSIKLIKPLLKENFDIIDCENFPYFPIFSCKIVSIIRQKPLIVSWLEVWNKYWFEYIGFKGIFGYIIERLSSKLPDRIISISDFTTKKLVNELNIKESKISTVYPGIDFEKIKESKQEKKEIDVISVCRLIEHKNLDYLIKSLALCGKKTNCLIVGNGPQKEFLENLSKEYKVDVSFSENIRDEKLYSLINSSKVFVLPSSREGFGMAVLEANALGVPVITVNEKDNAAKELVKNGRNGFVCRLDEKEIAGKIDFLLKNDNYEKFYTRCINSSQDYDNNISAEKILEVYGNEQ
jgi:glycosyltransferase involved in cell wall biosynthesis